MDELDERRYLLIQGELLKRRLTGGDDEQIPIQEVMRAIRQVKLWPELTKKETVEAVNRFSYELVNAEIVEAYFKIFG